MRRRIRRNALAALLVSVGFAAGAGFHAGNPTDAAFSASTTRNGNVFNAAPDWIAPTASAETIGRTGDCSPGTPGFIKPGDSYYVYATVADTGNPASGISTVRANTSTIDTGTTAANLVSGAYSAGGVAYTRRTASLTANTGLAAGGYTYSLTSTDVAGNAGTQGALPVTVDNTALTATDVQAVNVSGTAGRPDIGDILTFTFSNPVSPCSILAGWSGLSTAVVVRIANSAFSDVLTVWNSTNAAQLPLGSLDTNNNFVGGTTVTFGATGTASTMLAAGNSVTITLGTPNITANTRAARAMEWTPAAGATDRAGNACTVATVTESGTNDVDF